MFCYNLQIALVDCWLQRTEINNLIKAFVRLNQFIKFTWISVLITNLSDVGVSKYVNLYESVQKLLKTHLIR
ncbi:hypothetical protein T02_5355, partial [Trichinella nativa]